jgi:glutamate-1-semialdehyde 2,1-aminomutase
MQTQVTPFEPFCDVIPGGVSSPLRAFPGLEMEPIIVKSASGDTLIDIHGRNYVDYCCSCGALILGHAHPAVVEAATEQIAKGSTYWFLTELELQLAQTIVSLLPSVEQVRFVCSGTEATMTAARLARGYTGRSLIVKFEGCYHGHADLFLEGVGTITLPYNDSEAVQELFATRGEEIAAIIVEPIVGNMGVVPGDTTFLQTLRKETERAGALLIFDEVYTGFRVGLHGAQGLYNIDPDLTTLGKIVGGGYPLAALAGKRQIMEHLAPIGPVYQAGTLSANPVAVAASLATLTQLQTPGFYQTLQAKMDLFAQPIEEEIARRDLPASLQRVGSMWSLFLGVRSVRSFDDKPDHEAFARLFRHLVEQGHLLCPSQYEANFIGLAHADSHLESLRDHLLRSLL